jgi:hypothetical protein
LYEAAILELDPQLLLRRIDLARKAINLRVERLICSGESAEAERLVDAVNVLDDLRKMQARGAKEKSWTLGRLTWLPRYFLSNDLLSSTQYPIFLICHLALIMLLEGSLELPDPIEDDVLIARHVAVAFAAKL